ncbi:hypothetical protein GV828_04910 [Flavobacterium sp. NST-5]|uniref:Uncharacterized protein n=1 Tax=Flavobacterium ichthyis TaxID=2698827 RepID=A0ABW9Z789_9FLAO|nr:hypothetical protein [Flavobacterium ichthyis]NBL64539.1 hypothetical protein [Flavobacterium ichthyis]
MKKLKLELFLKIIGIGSASGLIFKDNHLFIISDNASVLYQHYLDENQLQQHSVIEIPNAPTENIPKKIKPDFEAITTNGTDYFLFGSGSTQNRKKLIAFQPNTKKNTETDLTLLYEAMQNFAEINPENFNIEGVIYTEKCWYFFNRGNGDKSQNGIFIVTGNLTDEFSIVYNKIKLPKINKIPSSFTDAVWHNNTIYFLAAAENTSSTYHDGEVAGTLIGAINPEKMKVIFTRKISDKNKFEGLSFFRESENKIEFLLCEDNDSEVLSTEIFKLTLPK